MTRPQEPESTENILNRRDFVTTSVATASVLIGAKTSVGQQQTPLAEASDVPFEKVSPFLTPAGKFRDVSRGNPTPHSLQGEPLLSARLTPETWRLEITTDEVIKRPAKISRPLTIADGTALDYKTLLKLGEQHGVKFIKAMQCLNIPAPLGQGLWEGVPVREVLKLCGQMRDVRRIAYWGFHNDDPKQMFRSSLSFTQAMETPPGELPPFLAYKLNGEPISLERGGPVRMIVPWAHGFKSIKWLNNIELTNDYRANDTYALQNNDPESHLKTAAYIDTVPKQIQSEQQITINGMAMVGLSGLARVEYWLRRIESDTPEISKDDFDSESELWKPCELEQPPQNWSHILPDGVAPQDVLGFDKKTGQPAAWPMRYSMIGWFVTFKDLPVGRYEFRARAVDNNGFAQPEPRTLAKTGRNAVEVRQFEVV